LLNITRACVILTFIVGSVGGTVAQSPNGTADQLFHEQKWAEAATAYEAAVKDNPKDAAAWYQLGMSRLALRQFEPAIEALLKNVSLKNNPNAMYNVACAYARLGQREKAWEWLSKADANRLPPFVNIADDEDLASLRDDARFKELAGAREKKRRPCLYSAAARQFDFWVGEWDVFNTQGQKAGTSVIQQVAEGCGILENWTDRFGATGKSLNFYDATSQKWNQYWIGAMGGATRYAGRYSDGAMHFEAEPTISNGVTMLQRLTFFNVDTNTVRQFAEQSTDNGKTWIVSYDFKYVRRK
jgi:tetratricopeptide (TPR) repeat protein